MNVIGTADPELSGTRDNEQQVVFLKCIFRSSEKNIINIFYYKLRNKRLNYNFVLRVFFNLDSHILLFQS